MKITNAVLQQIFLHKFRINKPYKYEKIDAYKK